MAWPPKQRRLGHEARRAAAATAVDPDDLALCPFDLPLGHDPCSQEQRLQGSCGTRCYLDEYTDVRVEAARKAAQRAMQGMCRTTLPSHYGRELHDERIVHMLADVVGDRWTSEVESRSHLACLFLPSGRMG